MDDINERMTWLSTRLEELLNDMRRLEDDELHSPSGVHRAEWAELGVNILNLVLLIDEILAGKISLPAPPGPGPQTLPPVHSGKAPREPRPSSPGRARPDLPRFRRG